MDEYDWYQLDNAAKIFPAISGPLTTSVYRVDVRLREPVKRDVLEEAVNKTLPFFPAFMVRLRQGLFWYYFEHNFARALVDEEQDYPTGRIDFEANNGYLFRFSYYHNKINLDVFHALSDGLGAMNFLIAVTNCYLKLCGKPVEDDSETEPGASKHSAMQDSFRHFMSPDQAEKTKKKTAYHIKGTPRPKGTVKVIHGLLEVEPLKTLAKGKNATVTTYLASALAFSIIETMPSRKITHPIRLFIPINLRRFFPSDTQRNFFTFIYIDIEPDQTDCTFDELLLLISEQMAERTKPDYFLPKASYYLLAEKNIFTRITPLFIKNLVLRMIYRQVGDKTNTCTVSNLGKIEVPPSARGYIDRFDVMLGTTKTNHLSCAVCSYGDQLVLSFVKTNVETDIERYFFRFLAAQGLKVVLEQNWVDGE